MPAGTRLGRPAAGAEREPVPVSIYYMVGNHDWFYHLPSPKITPLRQKLVDRMGLANRADEPFPHDMTENDDLLQVMRRHRVTARPRRPLRPLQFRGRPLPEQPRRRGGHRPHQPLLGRGGIAVGRRSAGQHDPGAPRDRQHPADPHGPGLDRRPPGADLHARHASAGQADVGPVGRRIPGDRLRPPARDVEPRWTPWTSCGRR